jgi:hypothetical protein
MKTGTPSRKPGSPHPAERGVSQYSLNREQRQSRRDARIGTRLRPGDSDYANSPGWKYWRSW